MKQKLPIGIQSFQKLRTEGFLYIDKTKMIHRLVTEGNYYFLSRPRRFGKSLTLSTIKELFSGKRELFRGLWIEKNWNWDEKHPVIHISFSNIGFKELGLEKATEIRLREIARAHDLTLEKEGLSQQFEELITKLSVDNKVVLLIDEYDKPIIDHLDDIPRAKANQQILKTFYSIIKDADIHIRLLLVTGVSKFSKVSIFSELNNLNDITIDWRFAGMFGYTQAELEAYFTGYLAEAHQRLELNREQLLEMIREWYNGYSWDGETFVYNPFSILNFFQKADFQNFWFSTGTPTFLIKLLRDREQIELENIEVDQSVFESYDLDHLDTLSLMFQTGYTTIKSLGEFGIYTLNYPNKEVKESMLRHLIGEFRHESPALTTPIVIRLRQAFLDHDLEQIMAIINGLFKSIPSHLFIKEKEAYYHSIVFLVFQYLGQFIEAEAHTSDGRADAVVQTPDRIYILEFKLDKSAREAMAQIRKKGYAGKYRLLGKEVIGIGINFSSSTKSVEEWAVEAL